MKTFKTMLKTELSLSLRGMDMFIFAICVPIVVLVILGILYGDKPAYPGAEFTGTIFWSHRHDLYLCRRCHGTAIGCI